MPKEPPCLERLKWEGRRVRRKQWCGSRELKSRAYRYYIILQSGVKRYKEEVVSFTLADTKTTKTSGPK